MSVANVKASRRRVSNSIDNIIIIVITRGNKSISIDDNNNISNNRTATAPSHSYGKVESDLLPRLIHPRIEARLLTRLQLVRERRGRGIAGSAAHEEQAEH